MPDMKVLMLVLSSDTQQVYKDLQASWKTFMKTNPHIDCWFYKADCTQEEEWKQTDPYTITVKCPDGHEYLYTKFIKAVQFFQSQGTLQTYDYICRPNESSFFVFERYLSFLENKPRVNVGFGKILTAYGVRYLSGCGFTLSRDVVERMILLQQKDYIIDDVTIGIALQKLGVQFIPYFYTIIDTDRKHVCIPDILEDDTVFHIRCKHESSFSRDLDVLVHRKFATLFYTKRIFPIPYAIPDEYIVNTIPEKKHVFAELIPGNTSQHIFGLGQEKEYHQHYRESRFARTGKKGGWDCLRHYEILAAGCIPVISNLQDCPTETMISFPKQLLTEAYSALLPWKETSDHIELYNTYVERLLTHCRMNCSTRSLTAYFLSLFPTIPARILMINGHEGVNYTREFLSIGLRRALGDRFIEYPRNNVLYTGCSLNNLHGNGYTYSEKFTTDTCNRENLISRITNHEFDVIIYGKVGCDEGQSGSCEGMPFLNIVQKSYTPSEIVFLYGGDGLQDMTNLTSRYTRHLLKHSAIGICCVRELRGDVSDTLSKQV